MKKEEDFFTRVYAVVQEIPKGRVTSYGAIANFLGTGLSARTVGWAMNSSSSSTKRVPAHRVVNSKGLLTGKHHFATPTLMQELLEAEGAVVIDNQIQDFEKIFWDPMKELKGKKNRSKSSLPPKQKTKSKSRLP